LISLKGFLSQTKQQSAIIVLQTSKFCWQSWKKGGLTLIKGHISAVWHWKGAKSSKDLHSFTIKQYL